MKGDEVVRSLQDLLKGDELIVSSNGNVSRQVFAYLHQPQVYLRGSMGLPMAVGFGLALSQPNKQVIVITGDGNFLMGLSSMATIAFHKPQNLKILVLDNGSYATTGGQQTVSSNLAYEEMISGMGIKNVQSVDVMKDTETLNGKLIDLLAAKELSVLHTLVEEDIHKLENIPWHPPEIKDKFLEKFD